MGWVVVYRWRISQSETKPRRKVEEESARSAEGRRIMMMMIYEKGRRLARNIYIYAYCVCIYGIHRAIYPTQRGGYTLWRIEEVNLRVSMYTQ